MNVIDLSRNVFEDIYIYMYIYPCFVSFLLCIKIRISLKTLLFSFSLTHEKVFRLKR